MYCLNDSIALYYYVIRSIYWKKKYQTHSTSSNRVNNTSLRKMTSRRQTTECVRAFYCHRHASLWHELLLFSRVVEISRLLYRRTIERRSKFCRIRFAKEMLVHIYTLSVLFIISYKNKKFYHHFYLGKMYI